ncbi:lysophospholipid acyltransferase family protein [Chelatococcus sp. SYSU_G07232]|uniref:Lysophospholipid acyltransferase family protein n=2 Tax=Chelatococcus albus TaxID=3047466 RepID=A0ABT7AMD1_9HYPH|nr:lysophospholipid acyltransferase family protein [Chelatococcus sp. SYSU_G07232]MDJ1160225.1 lysophospholipid acyltransferase family protein [Chelatococcus sp. SYSU_G07232]
MRSRPAQEALGFLFAAYLRLVRRTNRFVLDPPDIYDRVGPQMPVIAAMWHGQHFMISFGKRPQDRAAALVSRSADGEFNAIALRHLGVRAVRGSGARDDRIIRKGSARVREKGGAAALRGLLQALAQGEMVVMTADVPKVSRVCGPGIVMLARMSGRPIVPVAVVASRRIDFRSWDRASIGLPFGRGAIVIGEPIHVAADAEGTAFESARQAVENGLDAVHARAYALIGSRDPGARKNGEKTAAGAAQEIA